MNETIEPGHGVYTDADGTLAKSDTVNLVHIGRAIRANVAGTVKITAQDGTTATLNFTNGETRIVFAARVWVTGTSATGLEVMY